MGVPVSLRNREKLRLIANFEPKLDANERTRQDKELIMQVQHEFINLFFDFSTTVLYVKKKKKTLNTNPVFRK